MMVAETTDQKVARSTRAGCTSLKTASRANLEAVCVSGLGGINPLLHILLHNLARFAVPKVFLELRLKSRKTVLHAGGAQSENLP